MRPWGRVALGERAGRTLTRIGARPDREVAYVLGELCAQIDGFSLRARVRVAPAFAICSSTSAGMSRGPPARPHPETFAPF